LFTSLDRLQYPSQKLWDPLLELLKKTKLNNHIIIEAYQIISKLSQSGQFCRDLSKDVAFWKEKTGAQHDRTFRFNVEEEQWFTFQELKARREDYKFTDQKQRSYAEELTEEERRKQIENEARLAEERRQAERERLMNEIVKERYVQLIRGDSVTEFEGMNKEDEVSDSEEIETVETEGVYDEAEIDLLLQETDLKKPEDAKRKAKEQEIKAKKAREEARKVQEAE